MNPSNPKNPNLKPVAPAKDAGVPGQGPPPATRVTVPPLYRRIDWITFGMTTLLVFIGYFYTLAPDLTLQDCGELAVGSYYAGIPHPPGYPVWTIFTWLFTELLPISNISYRVAISSALAAAFACGLIALMVSRGSSMMMEGIASFKNIDRRVENLLCVVSGFVTGLLMGFNGFMWSQAVIVEVYTLSVLSLTGVLACVLRWVYAPQQYRYLYLAFFWYGICFNNHQSLLVIALGLEVAMVAVSPRLGRELFFWNSIVYVGGLAMKANGMLSVLSENKPLLVVYHLIGMVSVVAWIFLVVKTKKTALELARDFTLVGSIGYLLVLFGHLTSYVMLFYINNDFSNRKLGLFVLFNLAGLACIATFIYLLMRTRHLGREWKAALVCGAAWALGAAFYLYMPLAGMSNPPMQWGYPRTVQGFFHAFTRGQYERIHPTTSLGRYVDQIGMYVGGVLEEFNLVFLFIALVPFLFYKQMQKRERAWMVGLFAVYLTLSFFLLVLLNPSPDRQSRDLNKPFFTASHVMIAMAIGYGLTFIGSLLSTQYAKWRRWVLLGIGAAAVIAVVDIALTFQLTPNPIMRNTAICGLVLVAAGGVVLALRPITAAAPIGALAVVFAILPTYTIMSHWEHNEQRGHRFGFWFGHDMFTPPFDYKDGKPIYPEMDRHTVLYGGTDPGRFNPTYMIFCESFIAAKKKFDPNFDRRDVYLITQNALADGTYLMYIRAHYNRSVQKAKGLDTPFFTELLRGPQEVSQGFFTNAIARRMVPVDRFFTGLGERIEKNRRCGTSFFKENDFLNLTELAARLRPRPNQDPISKFVFEHLQKPTQDLVTSGGNEARLRAALKRDLNELLEAELNEQDPARRQPLYTPERFAGVKLSQHVQLFVKENPQAMTRIRLNRLLLEEAWDGLIARSPGGVYPDREIYIATPEDSQQAFQEYLTDAQRRLEHDRRNPNGPRQIRPGEDVKVIDNRVQVSGQVAVMAINGLITKIIFDHNPNHEFYVEESFPLDWMYPHLTPYGIIMKINRQPLPELTQDIVDRDHEFWSQYSTRLIGNWITYDTPISNICAFAEKTYYRRDYKGFTGDPKFVRDDDAQKAFSKLRSSIAGVYQWRVSNSRGEEQTRMIKEAEFSFKQAFAFCPYSPEALFRYVNLLMSLNRPDDALLLAQTSIKLDPNNGQIATLTNELAKLRQPQAGGPPPRPPLQASPQAEIARLEQMRAANPNDPMPLYQLASLYLQTQQRDKATEIAGQLLGHPQPDANMVTMAANLYAQLNQLPKVEEALQKLVQLSPQSPEAWFDLAGVQAFVDKPQDALISLERSLQLNAQRLRQNPASPNLYSNAVTDPRFQKLRGLPAFQKTLETNNPAFKAEAG